ncbi:MAG: L,D-transpeptidase family protein [Gammaproteobacteria bacterium]|nr:L,D-transpeptidase family protein [Gammaproteobacteria bacterium]
MRRYIIYILIAVISVVLFTRLFKFGPKVKLMKKPASQIEVLLSKAIELKSSSPAEAVQKFEKVVNDFPDSQQAAMALLEIANIYIRQNQLLKAEANLKQLIDNYPQTEQMVQAQKQLWNLNIAILFSSLETDDSMIYEVKPDDTLYRIAKRYETTVELIMKSNNLTSSLIKPGMKLKIVKSIFNIVVDKANNTLALKVAGEIVKVYPVGTGENNSTPVGKFKIVNRIVNPVWYKTGAIVPAGSPENILGTRWLGLSQPGYGIHGTIDPDSIGTQCTQGCIRMRNEDVEELFIIVPVGTEVTIK